MEVLELEVEVERYRWDVLFVLAKRGCVVPVVMFTVRSSTEPDIRGADRAEAM